MYCSVRGPWLLTSFLDFARKKMRILFRDRSNLEAFDTLGRNVGPMDGMVALHVQRDGIRGRFESPASNLPHIIHFIGHLGYWTEDSI
jgi:hypothetical protein